MKNIGISVYPEKANVNEWIEYIELAASLGFSCVFSCLLSVDTANKDSFVKDFKIINAKAHSKGMRVTVDVAPKCFKDLGISYEDLVFFKDIGADTVRLDVGFTGAEEALMTYNKYGLNIEINMSSDVHVINNIMDYIPNPYKLRGCHNFYPHRYTGLFEEHFLKTSERFKHFGLNTAAFITSLSASFGPWPVVDGLVTLEFMRQLSIRQQLKYFISLNGLIDDVYISNCFANKDELKSISSLNRDVLEFDIAIIRDLGEIEKKIIFDELHFNRGDVNEYLIRSTMPRVKYAEHSFKLLNARDMKRGDVIIESDLYGSYKGELQIALKDMKNSGKSSIVGSISESDLFLLDRIKPWQKFKFINN